MPPARFALKLISAITTSGGAAFSVERENYDGGTMAARAHNRMGHVLVSNDVKAYVKDGRRAQLEALGGTKIRTLVEFMDLVANGLTDDLLPPA